jgi:predicted AAA+ superfamily ATPase
VIETIKAMILDFQETKLTTGVQRHLKTASVKGKATICIGVRRGGKSTFMVQRIQDLLDKGVERRNILYINFFDDRLHALQHDGCNSITEAYYSLFPEKKNTEPIYCFFDEIQVVAGWERYVGRLMRTEMCEIYITGSSSRMLSKEIATQMRGRALSWELFPFSFREFLDYWKIDYSGSLSTKKRLLVQKAFGKFWETGGFPEVTDMDKTLRIKTHQEYYQTVLFRDLIERHDVSHPRAVMDLAHWLMDNIGSLYSINNLTGYLKSLGYKIPKASVSEYCAWFEDAFFLFTVRIFDASVARSSTNPKKIYCIDHSLADSVSSTILINAGHLLENLVFTALRRIYPEIYYYKTKSGKEIDFVIKTRENVRILIQVCETLSGVQTRKRELTALNEAMKELSVNSGTIVTRNEEERIDVDAGYINIVPAWRFLLTFQQ